MEVVYILLLTIVASGFGTITGFGSSTIMVPILLMFYPLPETLLLAGILHWFNDAWKVILFRQSPLWKTILSFGIPGLIFGVVGAWLVLSIPQANLSRFLGTVLIGYFALISIKSDFKIPRNVLSAMIGGSLSGFIAGIFGIGGAMRGLFLTALNLPKETYLFTSGMVALFIDTSRLITYALGGTRLTPTLTWGLVLFIPASFLGAELAKMIVGKIPPEKFRLLVAFFLGAVGLRLLLFPL